MNLIEFSDDFARSVANNMFWCKDTADTTDTSRFIYLKMQVIRQH